jgi:hypothetical protein
MQDSQMLTKVLIFCVEFPEEHISSLLSSLRSSPKFLKDL